MVFLPFHVLVFLCRTLIYPDQEDYVGPDVLINSHLYILTTGNKQGPVLYVPLSDTMTESEKPKPTSVLVVIDRQTGIAAQPTKPHLSSDVIRNASRLVQAIRENQMPEFLVHVVSTPETMLKGNSDLSFSRPSPLPPDWSEFVPEIAPPPSDIVIA